MKTLLADVNDKSRRVTTDYGNRSISQSDNTCAE
jgi:hypothetical protein